MGGHSGYRGGSRVHIGAIQADAPGDDCENLNGEYVEIVNDRAEHVLMTDWTLSDDGGHTYGFPDGFELASEATVTVHTGSGTDGDGDLYWGEDAPVWNNNGDTATLRDGSGTIVDEETYG